MFVLYYHPICPRSRFIRVLLNELKVEYQLKLFEFWLKDSPLKEINYHAELPVLITDKNLVISGIYPIVEYITDRFNKEYYFGDSNEQKAVTRELLDYCIYKLHQSCIIPLISQKIIGSYDHTILVDSKIIRTAKAILREYLHFFNNRLANKSANVAGEKPSIADIALASYISFADYLKEFEWIEYLDLKNWYLPIKSRPSFRFALEETFKGTMPPTHYRNLDF